MTRILSILTLLAMQPVASLMERIDRLESNQRALFALEKANHDELERLRLHRNGVWPLPRIRK